MESTSMLNREMPHSLEAEMAVLGAVLLDGESIGMVVEHLRSEDFYQHTHQAIFSAAVDLFNTATPVDVITLSQRLGDKLDAVGGVKYLAHLAQSVTTTANLKSHIEIVAGKSLARKLIAASGSISDMCYAQDEEPEDILDQAEQKIFHIAEHRMSGGLTPVREVVVDAIAQLDEVRKAGGKITGIPTGFEKLDHVTAGLHNSDLIFVAARPGMGKTAFALNIAANAAMEAKVPVAIFSLEMSKEQLVNRMLSSEALVRSDKMQIGNLDQKDIQNMSRAIGKLSAAPIFIDDTPGITVSEIRAKCRRMKLQYGLGLVVIDYLQLMQTPGRIENRVQAVSELSRSLKILAKELDVPVVTLSQLSRGPESRTDKRPMLSDLRESGSIEQDADVVMLLYREDYYDKETENQNIAECNIAKHRRGSTETVKLAWRGEYTRFMNLDPRQ